MRAAQLGGSQVTAQTPAERQEARRARLLMEGMTEVRGVFLPPALHAALKDEARRLLKRHQANVPPARS